MQGLVLWGMQISKRMELLEKEALGLEEQNEPGRWVSIWAGLCINRG